MKAQKEFSWKFNLKHPHLIMDFNKYCLKDYQ